MNTLAEAMFHEIQPQTYKVQLDNPNIKPPKSFRDAQGRETQWFEAFRKERDGMLRFQTWIRFPQNEVTPEMRRPRSTLTEAQNA